MLYDFLSGFIKTFFFAYLIGIIACHLGFSASSKDKSVGEITTLSVVLSSVMIVTGDFALTSFIFWII